MTEPTIGHNSGATKEAHDQLKSLVERIERVTEEKKALSDDIRDIFTEAKGQGFNVKALRQIVRLRAQDPKSVRELQETIDMYAHALGMA